MKNILTVLNFEYKGFVSAKSFRVVTIIFIVAIIAATSLPQIIGVFQSTGIDGGDDESAAADGDKAAFVLSGEAYTNEVYQEAFSAEALKGAGSLTWVDLSESPPDDAALSQAIQDGEYLLALRYSGGTKCEIFVAGNQMFSSGPAIQAVEDHITQTAKEAEMADLPAETREAVTRISALSAEPEIIDIGGDATSNYWIGYIMIMFLFYVIMGYTNYVSSSIITEKTSKAMELLVTSVKPIHLMVGKVIGVGCAALTQVGIIVGAFAAGIALNFSYWRETGSVFFNLIQGGNVDASVAIIVIVYFLLGFFLYAFLSAAFASTVSKPEDAATVMTIPMLLLMAALMLGFVTLFGIMNKGLVAALSYVPFFTPINMIARYTLGDAGLAQLVMGAVILAVTIVVIAILAAKIFRMGVMLYGVKIMPKQIWRALRNA